MVARSVLAELLIVPGQRVTTVGRLDGTPGHPTATLWTLFPQDPTSTQRLQGGSVVVHGTQVSTAARGVPVVVNGVWDGTEIHDAQLKPARDEELRIVTVLGDPDHPPPPEVADEIRLAALEERDAVATTISFGGSQERVHHYVLTVTKGLIDVVDRGLIRTEIRVAITPER
ncbi:hypothetical protein G3H63_03885 [Microbacterium resistens]|uniref:hypothetical protein n=1 Tax=Microbacterium resistens TaxID=156977 RepID=UPI001C56610F|nr:hypothetical protein [Microbacterium resistens]MBW1638221.1 hypothetical protein [Microbacterium resistens]